jgi:sterol desaturase/sphingolipid hydroxylase (fatty acid hydroxylase superfamily)
MGDQFHQAFTWGTARGELTGILTFVGLGTLYSIIFERHRFKLDMSSAGSFKAYVKSVVAYVLPRDFLLHPTQRANVVNYFLSMLYAPMLTAVATYAGLKWSLNVRDVLVGSLGGHAALLHNPWAVIATQVFGIYFVFHFLNYWGHFAFHRVPLLWCLHRVHHSAEVMTLFTARIHPLEDLIGAFIPALYTAIGSGLILYITGTDLLPSTMKAYTIATSILGFLTGVMAHSHFSLSFGKLSYIICGPNLHQIHHSAEPRHRDKNFGIGLMIFDWMFGTLYVPTKDETYRFGLGDGEMGENNPHLRIRDFYLEPIRNGSGIIRSWWRNLSLVK